MIIRDLTQDYLETILGEKNPAAYERSLPALFDHYLRFFGHPDRAWAVLDAGQIASRRTLLTGRLAALEERLTAIGLDVTDMEVVLMVGQGTSNGHAFRYKDRFVAWAAVEWYETELSADVFLCHEIVHALQYEARPAFFFQSKEEWQETSRQLITEGLATYVTREALGVDDLGALWADFLDQEEAVGWLARCRANDARLRQMAREAFDRSRSHPGLFEARDPGDIFNYRAGYYLGLRLIDEIADTLGLSIPDIVKLDRPRFETLIRDRL